MPKALIATVGGSPQPLIKSILEHRPEFVCFLCSQGSVEMVPGIKAQVKIDTQENPLSFSDYKVIVEDPDNLLDCYRKSQLCVDQVRKRGYSTEDTIVDFTGGTKAMAVSVGLGCISEGYSFSYVGGRERTKGGLGIVVDGSEKVQLGVNPWALYAIKERQQIADNFNTYQFVAARRATDVLLVRSGLDDATRQILKIIGLLSDGYSAWDRFKYEAQTVNTLKNARDRLTSYVQIGGHNEYESLLDRLNQNLTWLQKLQQASNGFRFDRKPVPELAADLLANADRRGEEGKFDDAVARLYRAIELIGQVALAEPPLEIFNSGQVPEEKIPERLRADYVEKYRDPGDGWIKLSLTPVYRLLAEVGHPRGAEFVQNEAELRKILHARNYSSLAHGFLPVEEPVYSRFTVILHAWIGDSASIRFPKVHFE